MVKNIYGQLCDMQNLEYAYNRAKKGKTQKDYVKKFAENLNQNLLNLQTELLLLLFPFLYLKTFLKN